MEIGMVTMMMMTWGKSVDENLHLQDLIVFQLVVVNVLLLLEFLIIIKYFVHLVRTPVTTRRMAQLMNKIPMTMVQYHWVTTATTMYPFSMVTKMMVMMIFSKNQIPKINPNRRK